MGTQEPLDIDRINLQILLNDGTHKRATINVNGPYPNLVALCEIVKLEFENLYGSPVMGSSDQDKTPEQIREEARQELEKIKAEKETKK